ncbi:galactose-1-phosphate uridylyltransferase [Desulfurococcus amylolyticus]|uniref:galactose-1-phosphate uridylyltransferase n=1 Tax=Desulfurococcus TaxID=2273 RepID=UPI0005B1FFD5|nr:galactose-1-phosphate uridylyltransferase [Desulfurococcus amylolyticus]
MERRIQELRWDPVLGEWVMVSSIREARPWQPEGFCPFCPGAPETGYGWDALILRNRYPMLSDTPLEPGRHGFYRTAPSYGRCWVVIETPIHDLDDISDLPVEHIARVLNLVVDKYREEKQDKRLVYFLFFRNKGREIGVSLTHPHSQIYVLPFVPVRVQREIENARRYYNESKECLFCRIIGEEEKERVRIVYDSSDWIAFIPFYAHWPFEVHIYPRRHVGELTDLTSDEVTALAHALKTVLCGLNRVLGKPMPYTMVLHQNPMHTRYPFYHLHIEIYGMYRTTGKLKYAAGMETGGGNFTYDSTPEYVAELLRKAIRENKCGHT